MRRYTAGVVTAGFVLAGILVAQAELKSANNSRLDKERITNPDRQTFSHPKGHPSEISAILIVQSLSCPCTVEACTTAGQIVDGLKEDYGHIVVFEIIDYEYQHEKAKPLLDKYNIFVIPTLLVFDSECHLLFQCEDFSNDQLIRAKFEQLLERQQLKVLTDEK